MSRDEAIEILYDMRDEYNLFGDEKEATRYHVLSWAIKEMKAIDPGRKIGTWIGIDDEPYEDFECDQCGTTYYTGGTTWDLPYFCPNCGADMRGEQNETN